MITINWIHYNRLVQYGISYISSKHTSHTDWIENKEKLKNVIAFCNVNIHTSYQCGSPLKVDWNKEIELLPLSTSTHILYVRWFPVNSLWLNRSHSYAFKTQRTDASYVILSVVISSTDSSQYCATFMAHMKSRNKIHNLIQKFVAQDLHNIFYICLYWSEIACIVNAKSTDVFDNVIQ
jgi:hypothetical protein